MLANCDQLNSKLRVVAGAEGFWVVELRVRQLKIGSKSCFGFLKKSIMMLKSLKNELFFTFELNEKLVQNNVDSF